MTEQLTSFKNAKLANEKGFNEYCLSTYFEVKPIYVPTQALLQKWLREKHNIQITILRGFDGGSKNWFYIGEIGLVIANKRVSSGTTYEEVLEEALFEALKLIP